MSQITEYLKLFVKGLPHTDDILESIVNNIQMKWGHLPEEERGEILKRRLICASCPFMSKNSPTSEEWEILKGSKYKTKRKDEHCSFCGCTIDMRTASLNSNCGIESWNSENPDKPLPLKWTKYGE